MIVRAYKYRGRRADALRLYRHLSTADGQKPRLFDVRNLFVHHGADGMAVMAAIKAASKATIAFWQIVVSPRRTLDADELIAIVDLIIAELQAQQHPLLVFLHEEKPRARRGGANHLHLVLGHVSPVTFRALDMRQHLPRLHKAMAVAAFQIEGVPTASPWHRSIVRVLRAQGRSDVADWLVASLGEAPSLKAPRMSDKMRRSAQAAGFPLAAFQAGLDRLWTSGAEQAEIKEFLSNHGVVVGPARSVTVIPFYHDTCFVGALHRILQRDVRAVYDEASLRIPEVLREARPEAPAAARPGGSGGPNQRKAAEASRRAALELQRRLDFLERSLARLRLERLQLQYPSDGQPPLLGPLESAAASGLSDHGPDHVGAELTGPGIGAARIKRLEHAEAILEAAVSLLLHDHRWMENSLPQLLRSAKSIVHSSTRIETNVADNTEDCAAPDEALSPFSAFTR